VSEAAQSSVHSITCNEESPHNKEYGPEKRTGPYRGYVCFAGIDEQTSDELARHEECNGRGCSDFLVANDSGKDKERSE